MKGIDKVLTPKILWRRDQNPDLAGMIGRVVENFRFLEQLTDAERTVAADAHHRQRPAAAALAAAAAAA